jgi:hypothetical protein
MNALKAIATIIIERGHRWKASQIRDQYSVAFSGVSSLLIQTMDSSDFEEPFSHAGRERIPMQEEKRYHKSVYA